MKNVTISAIEQDGRHTRCLSIDLSVRDGMSQEEVVDAIMKASTEYCRTEEGRKTYEGNCNNFNYGDFEAYVPDEICEKFGIKKIDSMITTFEVVFDSQLVSESDIFPEDDDF